MVWVTLRSVEVVFPYHVPSASPLFIMKLDMEKGSKAMGQLS